MSSSSKRLRPIFSVRVCRLEGSGLDGAVLANGLIPAKSRSAELLLTDIDMCEMTLYKQKKTCFHTH